MTSPGYHESYRGIEPANPDEIRAFKESIVHLLQIKGDYYEPGVEGSLKRRLGPPEQELVVRYRPENASDPLVDMVSGEPLRDATISIEFAEPLDSVQGLASPLEWSYKRQIAVVENSNGLMVSEVQGLRPEVNEQLRADAPGLYQKEFQEAEAEVQTHLEVYAETLKDENEAGLAIVSGEDLRNLMRWIEEVTVTTSKD